MSDPRRWSRRRAAAGKRAPRLLQGVLDGTFTAYSGLEPDADETSTDHGLMDPLCVLERLQPGDLGDRQLPAFFLPVGVADPLVDDHRRMEVAITRLGGVAEACFYPGMEHAFHAFVWREAAQRCWKDTFSFAVRYLD